MNTNQNKLFHSINQFTRHFSKTVNEALVPLGLFSAQWTIIYRLKNFGPATQKELSQYLSVEAPTMTRTLARLEKSGWITKVSGTDKREKRVMLTEAALKEYDRWLHAVCSCEDRVLQNVSKEEILIMQSVLEKMNVHLK